MPRGPHIQVSAERPRVLLLRPNHPGNAIDSDRTRKPRTNHIDDTEGTRRVATHTRHLDSPEETPLTAVECGRHQVPGTRIEHRISPDTTVRVQRWGRGELTVVDVDTERLQPVPDDVMQGG